MDRGHYGPSIACLLGAFEGLLFCAESCAALAINTFVAHGAAMTASHPDSLYSHTARLLAGAIAALALVALSIQPMLGENSYSQNLVMMLRFFTIWGNAAAMVLMAAIAAGRNPSAGAMAALATMLTVIGSIYWILLADIHHPVGLDRVTNQVHHTIVPIASVLFWLRYTPRASSTVALIPAIMVPPLSYGAFALILGQLTGFYAYFFVDLSELGWGRFLINNIGLALFFALLGAVLLWIKNACAQWSAA